VTAMQTHSSAPAARLRQNIAMRRRKRRNPKAWTHGFVTGRGLKRLTEADVGRSRAGKWTVSSATPTSGKLVWVRMLGNITYQHAHQTASCASIFVQSMNDGRVPSPSAVSPPLPSPSPALPRKRVSWTEMDERRCAMWLREWRISCTPWDAQDKRPPNTARRVDERVVGGGVRRDADTM
jgi:hypothetical protein